MSPLGVQHSCHPRATETISFLNDTGGRFGGLSGHGDESRFPFVDAFQVASEASYSMGSLLGVETGEGIPIVAVVVKYGEFLGYETEFVGCPQCLTRQNSLIAHQFFPPVGFSQDGTE